TRFSRDWSSDVCSSDLKLGRDPDPRPAARPHQSSASPGTRGPNRLLRLPDKARREPTVRTLVWFRGKDLRLGDHRPLTAALEREIGRASCRESGEIWEV